MESGEYQATPSSLPRARSILLCGAGLTPLLLATWLGFAGSAQDKAARPANSDTASVILVGLAVLVPAVGLYGFSRQADAETGRPQMSGLETAPQEPGTEPPIGAVLEIFDEGVMLIKPDYSIVRANQKVREMYGFDSRRQGTVIPPPSPDHHKGLSRGLAGAKCYEVCQTREAPCPWCPLTKALETGRPHAASIPYPSQDAPTGWLRATAHPVLAGEGMGKASALVTVRRIERHDHAQNVISINGAMWEATFDAVEDPMILLDATRRILRVNQALCGRLGLNRAACIGRDCRSVLKIPREVVAMLINPLGAGKTRQTSAFIEVPGLGGEFKASVSAVLDVQGQFSGSVILLRGKAA